MLNADLFDEKDIKIYQLSKIVEATKNMMKNRRHTVTH